MTKLVAICIFKLGEPSKLKMSQIVKKKSKRGGGGVEFFTFFPNSNNRNMTLIFMIYGTDIGEIYATFGTYMAYI